MIDDNPYTKVAELFDVVGHTSRIAILKYLNEKAKPASSEELAKSLDIKYQTLAYHLKLLKSVALIKTIRHGKHVEYYVNDTAFTQMLMRFSIE